MSSNVRKAIAKREEARKPKPVAKPKRTPKLERVSETAETLPEELE